MRCHNFLCALDLLAAVFASRILSYATWARGMHTSSCQYRKNKMCLGSSCAHSNHCYHLPTACDCCSDMILAFYSQWNTRSLYWSRAGEPHVFYCQNERFVQMHGLKRRAIVVRQETDLAASYPRQGSSQICKIFLFL